VDLMLDCWMAYDVDYTVRMCEALRPYRMRWMEEMLQPQDWAGLRSLRRRLPWQSLATGEHWSTRWPGAQAIEERLVDLIQADLRWVGGLPTRLAQGRCSRDPHVPAHRRQRPWPALDRGHT
jgi:L-rhamnonate dehydratase